MNATSLMPVAARSIAAIRVLSLGLLLSAGALPNHAAETGSAFNVKVTLRPPDLSNTGSCSNNTGVGAFGATVTVVCGTGTVIGLEATGTGMPWRPVHGGAFRFLTQISGDALAGTVDSYTSADTSTAFRIVSSAGREYIEMTVGW